MTADDFPEAVSLVDPSLEQPQRSSGNPSWYESWVVECVDDSGDLGVRMELRVRPDQNRSQFSLLLVRRDRPVVWLDESEAPLPRPGLEVRASGLWMEFVALEPLEHFTADLEAFALSLDDPDDALGSGFGYRVPVACELEWQSRGGPERVPGGYRIPAFAMGDFQCAHEDVQIDGWGWRSHTWGSAVPVDPFRGRAAGTDAAVGESWDFDPSVALVLGWGHGLDGEVHRLIESDQGIGWRTTS